MRSRRTGRLSTQSYLDLFAAQVPLFGHRGQFKLRRAHVLVIGAGGAGTATMLSLAAAGVGRLTAADPQAFAFDNFNRNPVAKLTDVGVPKVEILAGMFAAREYLDFRPIVGRCESLTPSAMSSASLIVSASNTTESRQHAAWLAVMLGRPHVGIGVFDARQALGGVVTVWLPHRRDLACQACFLTPNPRVRNESLFGPAVACVGAWAAHIIVTLLTGRSSSVLNAGNVLTIDLGRPAVEAWRVRRRPGCPVCGAHLNPQTRG
jgi:adenylyltransferase/sulfurtransferase